MKACVVFKDGTELAIRLPDNMAEADEITVGRPDRVENVKARYSRTTPRGVDVYVEVDS